MSRVETFTTRIKLNQVIKALLGGRSKDQGDLWTAKNQQSRMCSCNLTFDPWNDQAHSANQITWLWSLYRWYISDCPLTLGVARLVNCWSHTHLRIKSVICKVHFINSYSQLFPHPKIVDLKRLFQDLTSAVLWEGSSVGAAGFFWCEKHWPSLCNTWVACSIRSIRVSSNWRQIQKETGRYTS